jgi:hypothetical protein
MSANKAQPEARLVNLCGLDRSIPGYVGREKSIPSLVESDQSQPRTRTFVIDRHLRLGRLNQRLPLIPPGVWQSQSRLRHCSKLHPSCAE